MTRTACLYEVVFYLCSSEINIGRFIVVNACIDASVDEHSLDNKEHCELL